jgi:maltodextrin utilization protein YvdJ
MMELIIGSVATTAFFLLVGYVRQKNIELRWWQWALVILGFLYTVFVAEVVVSFLDEGSFQAAVVMGAVLGFVAVIWGVLLGRFVFTRAAKRRSAG